MGYLIDTSALLAAHQHPDCLDPLVQDSPEEDFYLSVISAADLLYAAEQIAEPTSKIALQAYVDSVMDQVPILPLDRSIARIHARLSVSLNETDLSLSNNDTWLAASCLAYGLTMVTLRNEMFGELKGMEIHPLIIPSSE